MVVPVLMTSCQVSLNPNNGPVTAHTTITNVASMNVDGRPAARAVHLAKRENTDRGFVGLMQG
jgi:hypothetical protein